MRAASLGALLLLMFAAACGTPAPVLRPAAAPVMPSAAPAPAGPCDEDAAEADIDAPEAFGKIIERICVYGVPPEVEKDVRAYLREKPGGTVSEAELSRDLRNLFTSSFFGRVDATARPASKGTVELAFHVELRPTITSFRIEGATNLPSDATQWKLFREGNVLDPASLHREADKLRDQYIEDGFERVSIAREITPDGANAVRVRVVVTEGVRNVVGAVRVLGVPKPLEIAAQQASQLRGGASLTERDLYAAAAHVYEFCSARGHGEASVSVARGEASDAAVVPVTITVKQGPVYRLGKVNAELESPTLEREMLRLVRSTANAPYDGAKLAADAERMTKALNARGHRTVLLVRPSWNRETKTADVTFAPDPNANTP